MKHSSITVPAYCLHKCSYQEPTAYFILLHSYFSRSSQTLPNLTLCMKNVSIFAKSQDYCVATLKEKQDLQTRSEVAKSLL